MDTHDIWSAVLSVGMFIIGFYMTRMTNILDKLQSTDEQMAKEVSNIRTEYVPKAEFVAYGDRLERRLEAFQSLHMESNKVIFSKLDNISEKLADKVSRSECVSNLQKHSN